jgi:hypothetical protein
MARGRRCERRCALRASRCGSGFGRDRGRILAPAVARTRANNQASNEKEEGEQDSGAYRARGAASPFNWDRTEPASGGQVSTTPFFRLCPQDHISKRCGVTEYQIKAKGFTKLYCWVSAAVNSCQQSVKWGQSIGPVNGIIQAQILTLILTRKEAAAKPKERAGLKEAVSRGLKPLLYFRVFVARLKSCPFTAAPICGATKFVPE